MTALSDYAFSFNGSFARSENADTGISALARDGVRKAARPSGKAAASAQGLSTCHISPQIEYRKEASILTVKRGKWKTASKLPVSTPKRGKIKGFSPKSRNRLMRTLASVRKDKLPVFVTLTYPSEFPSPEQAKRHLDTFVKRLARKFPNVAGVWKLEPQQRGAPHFHLLVWGADFEQLRAFVPLAWYEIAGNGDEKHLLWHFGALGNKPCVQRIETQRGVFWYASKYMSKETGESLEGWGRMWGVFFRERLPFGETVNIPVSEQKAIEFIRYMRRYSRVRSRDYKALTVICNADVWVNRLL